jgi:zeaxanthin glucosyltransferase
MTTLARKLKARGHDVVFLSVPDTEPFVRAAELPLIPFCEKDFPVGSLAKSMAVLSKLQGQAALEMAINSVANTMESAFRNPPRTLRDTNVDALVLDESQRGLGAVPLHLGMPYAHVSNALPFDFQGKLQYIHLTGNMRRSRRPWPEIRQVGAAYCKSMSQ